jgi:hypothetical protein
MSVKDQSLNFAIVITVFVYITTESDHLFDCSVLIDNAHFRFTAMVQSAVETSGDSTLIVR